MVGVLASHSSNMSMINTESYDTQNKWNTGVAKKRSTKNKLMNE